MSWLRDCLATRVRFEIKRAIAVQSLQTKQKSASSTRRTEFLNPRGIVYMTDRSVVITGVSTGIGWNAASFLLKRNFRVFGSVRTQADADRLQKEFSIRSEINLPPPGFTLSSITPVSRIQSRFPPESTTTLCTETNLSAGLSVLLKRFISALG